MHFIDQAPTSNRNKATSAMKTFPVLLAFILVALGFESRAAAPTPTNTLITTNIPITTNVTGGYFLVHVPVSGSSLGLRQASLAVVSAAIGGGGVSLSTVTNIVVGITQPQSNALRTLTLQVGLANTNYTTAVSNSLYSLAYALAASGTNNVTSLSNAIIAYVNSNSSITNAVGGAGQYQLLLGNKLRRLEFTGDATVTTNGDLISVDVTAGAGASNSINGAQATNIFVGLATASNWATVTYAQSLTNPMATTAFVNSALASYTPLTLATNLRTLVVLTSSGATSIATNSGQITLTINTNVSGGGGVSGSDATNIFTGLAIASNWLATSTFNTSTSAIVGLIDSRSTALSNYTALAFLTNANNVQQRLITNQSVKTFSAGSNMTITDQGTNLVLAASLAGGAASLQDVTNIVQDLSILSISGSGTGTSLLNPTNQYSLASAASRGFSNYVFVANRPDGIDGDGFTRENPRHAADGAAVSNIFRSLRSSSRIEFMEGSEWTNLNLVLQSSNPGQTNGLFQIHGLRDVLIVGGKFRGTNYGTMFTIWQSTNIMFRDMNLSSPRSHTRLTNSAHALIACAIGPTENVVFKDMIMPEYTQHGFGQYGTDHKGWTVLNSKFNDGGNTNVPSLFIDGVAISVNSGWALIDGNRFTRLSRGFETYIPPSSTTWMTNVVVVNNIFEDIEQAAIQHYGDATATNSGLLNGFVFANNVITMANTNAAIPSGASLPVGIVVLGGARNGVIADNVVRSSDTGHFYAGSGINVTASQGHQEDILVANNRIEGIFQDRGIQTYGNTFGTGGGFYPQANAVIDGNHLDQCNTTILIGGLYPVVQNNKLGTHYIHGINVSAGTLGAEIVNNTTRGFNVPVIYIGAATNTVMQGNNWDFTYTSDNGTGTVLNEAWRYSAFRHGTLLLTNNSVYADAVYAKSTSSDFSGVVYFVQNGVIRGRILTGTGAGADSGKMVFEVDGRSHFTIMTNLNSSVRVGAANQPYFLLSRGFNNTNGMTLEAYDVSNNRLWYLGTSTNDGGLDIQSTAAQTRFLGTKSLTISNGVAYGDGTGLTNLTIVATGTNISAPTVVLSNGIPNILVPTNNAALNAVATGNSGGQTNYHQTNIVTGLQTWLAIPSSIPMQRGLTPNPIMIQTNGNATITSWVPVSGLPSNAYLAISNSSGGNITITTTGTGRFMGTATNSLVIGSGKFGFIYVESLAGASTNIMGTIAQQ